MSKVKADNNFDIIDEDLKPNTLYVVWDCDDKVGYGVEFSDNETGIASWSFGDNSIESYILSKKLFDFINETLSSLTKKQEENLKDKNLPLVDVSLSEELIDAMVWIENEKPTEVQINDVLTIIKIITDHYGKHPLKEKDVEKLRENFGWPKVKGLWSHLIQETA